MGYTHYYERRELNHDINKWGAFVQDAKIVATNSGITIKGGLGTDGPVFDAKMIWLNGDASVGMSHETLHIEQMYTLDPEWEWETSEWESKGIVFNFCKTNLKPYDVVVTAILALYKYYFDDAVSVYGDGGPEGFKAGIDLIEKHLGYKIALMSCSRG